MLWQNIAHLSEIAILASFAAMFVIVIWQILDGRILISGMLAHRDGRLRFHRLQMVGISLMFAAGYAIEALGKGPVTSLPDISTPLLVALVGSHATFLGGKLLG